MDTFLEALETAATCIRAGDREKAAKLIERTAAVLRGAVCLPDPIPVSYGDAPGTVQTRSLGASVTPVETAQRPPVPWIQVDGADVVSPHWRLKAADPGQAKRIAEVIGGIYRAGQDAKAQEIADALGVAR